MANKLRNEVEITLNGVKYPMRPTFDVICSIEDELGLSLIDIIADSPKLRARDWAKIVFHGIRGAEHHLKLEDIGPALLSNGLENGIKPALVFLQHALQGVSLGKSVGELEKAAS
jgi:hypothetical protein